MSDFHNLSDSLLIEAYKRAIELSLSKDFIKLLEKEIIRRNLSLKK